LTRHILPKSPLPPLCQRGEFLPLVKGGKEGFSLKRLYNYGLTNNNRQSKDTHFLLEKVSIRKGELWVKKKDHQIWAASRETDWQGNESIQNQPPLRHGSQRFTKTHH